MRLASPLSLSSVLVLFCFLFWLSLPDDSSQKIAGLLGFLSSVATIVQFLLKTRRLDAENQKLGSENRALATEKIILLDERDQQAAKAAARTDFSRLMASSASPITLDIAISEQRVDEQRVSSALEQLERTGVFSTEKADVVRRTMHEARAK